MEETHDAGRPDRPQDRDPGSADERRRSEERAERRRRRRRARKERVLHTRISEDLAEDIRRMADEMRVPVSNIVRTVLEEAFSVVETVTDNVGDLIEEVVDEAEAARDRIRRRARQRRRSGAQSRSEWAEGRLDDIEDVDVESDAPAAEEVIGWQPMLLARAQACGECGTVLGKGVQAFAAVTSRGLGASYRCEDCLRRDGAA